MAAVESLRNFSNGTDRPFTGNYHTLFEFLHEIETFFFYKYFFLILTVKVFLGTFMSGFSSGTKKVCEQCHEVTTRWRHSKHISGLQYDVIRLGALTLNKPQNRQNTKHSSVKKKTHQSSDITPVCYPTNGSEMASVISAYSKPPHPPPPPPPPGELPPLPEQIFFFPGGLEGIADLIITASAHLADPSASISLLDPFSLALPHLVASISPLSLPPSILSSDAPVFWGFRVRSVPHLVALRPVTAAHIPENTTSCALGRRRRQQNEAWSNCTADEQRCRNDATQRTDLKHRGLLIYSGSRDYVRMRRHTLRSCRNTF